MPRETPLFGPAVVPSARSPALPLWAGAMLFAGALSLSLGLKIAEGTYTPGVDGPDHSHQVASLLQRNGFRVQPQQQERHVAATGGLGCRITVVQPKSQGWDQHSTRQLAHPGDDYFVVFNDFLYDEHPKWRIKGTFYLDRILRHVGVEPPDRPVFAVIASPTCSVRDLPWHDLT